MITNFRKSMKDAGKDESEEDPSKKEIPGA
jgi:hypothetical protein